SRFAVSAESSAHENFKQKIIGSTEGETIVTLKQLTPVRLIKNKFYESIKVAEENCAGAEELKMLLGKGRSRKGILEGDLEEGELEIGQIAAAIKEVKPADEILREIWEEYLKLKKELQENTP
ncbi:MAG TPA: nitronate monooxygenase, partial [Cytophagaceae bacterium]|nr:nitronate monooxygenase [Cytophagaceae bacterium]